MDTHGDVPDLRYEEIAGSTESLFRASTIKKLVGNGSFESSSLTYSAASSVNDLSDVQRLRESVTQLKSKVTVECSPDQIRESLDHLRSSSLKFSHRRSKGEMKPEREDKRPLDVRKSAERIVALAENQAVEEGNVQASADVILQVFREYGGRPTVDQLIALVRRLKRVPDSGSSDLSHRLNQEQQRTDTIKQQLSASKTQISALTSKIKEHSMHMDGLTKAVLELYNLMRSLNDEWAKERKAVESMKGRDEAATIKRSLQESEKRYQETKRLIGAETQKMSEMRIRLPSPDSRHSVSTQTDPTARVAELLEQREQLATRIHELQEFLHTVESQIETNADARLHEAQARLGSIRRDVAEAEGALREVAALARRQQK